MDSDRDCQWTMFIHHHHHHCCCTRMQWRCPRKQQTTWAPTLARSFAKFSVALLHLNIRMYSREFFQLPIQRSAWIHFLWSNFTQPVSNQTHPKASHRKVKKRDTTQPTYPVGAEWTSSKATEYIHFKFQKCLKLTCSEKLIRIFLTTAGKPKFCDYYFICVLIRYLKHIPFDATRGCIQPIAI